MPGILWVLVSLLAVATVGDAEFVSLGVAVLGGVAMGLAAAWGQFTGSGQASARQTTISPAEIDTRLPTTASRRFAGWVVANEVWLLFAASPLFLLARPAMVPVLLLVPVLWILRWRVRGELARRTPLDWPILCLLITLLVGFLASADRDASFPKLAGVLFGVGAFYAMVNRVRSRLDLEWMTAGLVVIGLGIGLIGFLGTGGLVSGKFIPVQIAALLQRGLLLPGVTQGLVNPNEVAGSLAWVVPVLAVLAITRWNDRMESGGHRLFSRVLSIINGRGLAVAFVVASGLILLTQSRSALFGVAVSLLVLGVTWWWRRFRWPGLLLATGVSIVGLTFGLLPMLQTLDRLGTTMGGTGTLDWASRQEVWERALLAIQDFPFTGVGLNMFDPVSKLLYPYFLIPPDRVLAHAHNIYLQVAVDLGLPGLVAYIALLTAFAAMIARVAIAGALPRDRALAMALGLGILAHQIFGLTDAITLGAKPGILFWMILGLAGGLWWLDQSRAPSRMGPLGDAHEVDGAFS